VNRRQLLALIAPALILPVLAGRVLAEAVNCKLPGLATLVQWLKPFADPVLGKQLPATGSVEWLQRFAGSCPGSFAEHFRHQAESDFAQGKTVEVDGWILSETEAHTHRLVYQYTRPDQKGQQ
jgi:hypothetical protein